MDGVNVAICTMEKANSIVNRLAEEKRLAVSMHSINNTPFTVHLVMLYNHKVSGFSGCCLYVYHC